MKNVIMKKLQRGKVVSEVEWKTTPLLFCKGVQKKRWRNCIYYDIISVFEESEILEVLE